MCWILRVSTLFFGVLMFLSCRVEVYGIAGRSESCLVQHALRSGSLEEYPEVAERGVLQGQHNHENRQF